MQEQNAMVYANAHSTHVVQYFTDWGNMDIFVSGNVLGSFITALQFAK